MFQIICRDLTLGYDGVTVCEHLDLQVNKGEYLCIVGDNGSGKSTLMKALLGLKAPDRGSITFGEGMSHGDIGYLPQQSEHQRDFPATAYEVVLSGCVGTLKKGFFYGRASKTLARTNMDKLGISNLSSRSYSSLSGGQQQRVMLSRALCAAKEIILLDEPVSGLDPASTSEMYDLIQELNKNTGMTVIMVTHDISAALKYADRILYMGEHPILFNSPEEYKQSRLFVKEREDNDE